jgi:hypothetical protein
MEESRREKGPRYAKLRSKSAKCKYNQKYSSQANEMEPAPECARRGKTITKISFRIDPVRGSLDSGGGRGRQRHEHEQKRGMFLETTDAAPCRQVATKFGQVTPWQPTQLTQEEKKKKRTRLQVLPLVTIS